ncbi:MAG: hypothetical protein ACTILJ_09555 [Pseudolactococcus laudensis]|uniref:hypothetical protein n=1 Tax=Pseudolactococcus laudensis TaxID=1494461 RepID=UPI003F9AB849
MCKIIKGVAIIFIAIILHPTVVLADESSQTINSDISTLDVSQQDFNTTPRAISGGTGTANDPFLVSTIADLQTALTANISSGESSLYIKLTADIVYSDIPVTISKNTVLDGDNHYILYSGTNYTTAHFWLVQVILILLLEILSMVTMLIQITIITVFFISVVVIIILILLLKMLIIIFKQELSHSMQMVKLIL